MDEDSKRRFEKVCEGLYEGRMRRSRTMWRCKLRLAYEIRHLARRHVVNADDTPVAASTPQEIEAMILMVMSVSAPRRPAAGPRIQAHDAQGGAGIEELE